MKKNDEIKRHKESPVTLVKKKPSTYKVTTGPEKDRTAKNTSDQKTRVKSDAPNENNDLPDNPKYPHR